MIKKLYKKYYKVISYGIIAILITILDIGVSRILFKNNISLTISNTVGIISGSLAQYYLTIKFTFKSEYNTRTFFIHLITFGLGLILSNIVINKSFLFFSIFYNEKISFYLSKLSSIVATFFITFVIRNILYSRD